ncbi:MAG: hypothetical protein JWN93_2390 [Hyphomicrobiales bacterium]|nr:hypothetical protein [Hyphomicrobiales bacterium]
MPETLGEWLLILTGALWGAWFMWKRSKKP